MTQHMKKSAAMVLADRFKDVRPEQTPITAYAATPYEIWLAMVDITAAVAIPMVWAEEFEERCGRENVK